MTNIQQQQQRTKVAEQTHRLKRTIAQAVSVVLIATPALIVSMGTAEAGGDFSRSCKFISLNAHHHSTTAILTAYCRRRDGSYKKSSINLNNYITNTFGRLRWQRGGNFAKSCSNIGFDFPFSMHRLTASCEGGGSPNHTYSSSVDLNAYIANIDGNLTYVGR